MKIRLLQIICLIAGVGFLSFGTGLFSGRIGAQKQGVTHAPAVQQPILPEADVSVPAGGETEPALAPQPQVVVEEKIQKTEPPKITPQPVRASAPVKELKEIGAPAAPLIEDSFGSRQSPAAAVKEAGGPPQETKYVVQALSTPNRSDAASARNKMVVAGFPAGIFEVNLGSKGMWYRVYVGPFDSESEALATLDSVRQMAGFGSSFIKTLE